MRIASLITFVALTLGCAHTSPFLVLDDHGGFSHAGRRVELQSDGSYTDIRYTDVIGDQRKKHGVYTIDEQKALLTLSPVQGEPERLYRMDFGSDRYWVPDRDRDRIKETNEDWLRQISLKEGRKNSLIP
jgi:hypothetical protein